MELGAFVPEVNFGAILLHSSRKSAEVLHGLGNSLASTETLTS